MKHLAQRCPVMAVAMALITTASAATLNGSTQAVMPASTRQIISLDYHRLAGDPVAMQVEAQVLPPQMIGLAALLQRGGLNPASDLNRLTFATFAEDKDVGLIGVAEGNFGGLQLTKFYEKTPKQPNPPQISGVNAYTSGGLTFFLPDASTLVFGSRESVTSAIQAEQSGRNVSQNEGISDLVSGTQPTDAWSVLDANGTQAMIKGMLAAGGTGGVAGLDAKLLDNRFTGARYTISFSNPVQLNLEVMATDTLTAAAVSTGLNAAVAVEQHRQKDPAAKTLLSQIQVDSAGSHAFLQLAAQQNDVASLLHSDLLQTILHK